MIVLVRDRLFGHRRRIGNVLELQRRLRGPIRMRRRELRVKDLD
jgi:hypothetical protein